MTLVHRYFICAVFIIIIIIKKVKIIVTLSIKNKVSCSNSLQYSKGQIPLV